MSDPTCKACQRVWPRPDHLIADLGLTKIYLHDDQFFAGWTVALFQRHATELFHLAPTERFQLIEEVTMVAKALAEVFDANKINYELLGNQLPHIHWHLIPRLAADPARLEPVWRVPHEPLALAELERQARIERIRARLPASPFPSWKAHPGSESVV
jgi:diadenosine tetraphosphate (Ap4A) HIT family hydrolase